MTSYFALPSASPVDAIIVVVLSVSGLALFYKVFMSPFTIRDTLLWRLFAPYAFLAIVLGVIGVRAYIDIGETQLNVTILVNNTEENVTVKTPVYMENPSLPWYNAPFYIGIALAITGTMLSVFIFLSRYMERL